MGLGCNSKARIRSRLCRRRARDRILRRRALQRLVDIERALDADRISSASCQPGLASAAPRSRRRSAERPGHVELGRGGEGLEPARAADPVQPFELVARRFGSTPRADQARDEMGRTQFAEKGRVERDLVFSRLVMSSGVLGISACSIGLIWTMITSRQVVS